MNFLTTIILGVVEGITEFLPVSSTGHLILTAKLLGLAQSDFLKSFEIIIQLGAILAVIVLYWKILLINFKALKRIAVAFIPTALIGFTIYKSIKKFLLGNNQVVLWSLFLGGIVIIVFERIHREKKEAIGEISELSYGKAFMVGLFQSIAMIPGVSRSAASILGGLTLSLKRKTAVEFSFLLAVPTMLAATGLDLVKSAGTFSSHQVLFLLSGFVTAFIVAILAIKFLLQFIENHNFTAFGIYRVLLALIFWLALRV